MNPPSAAEKRYSNKSRIARFISRRGAASKPEIAAALKLSMPTVLQNVKCLAEAGIIRESGQYQSTGGRKARILSLVPDYRFSVGIDITANHVSFVLVNMAGTVIRWQQNRRIYTHSLSYCRAVREDMNLFLKNCQTDPARILGVGISLPGIIDKAGRTLIKSHVLDVDNVSLTMFSQFFDREPVYENDATSAAMAELNHLTGNAVYLSLSNTVGGAVYIDQQIYPGDHFRSAEFGHVVLVPGGEVCYCGKQGCVDAYCSAKVLSRHSHGSLDAFFIDLTDNDPEALALWDRYLDYLAVTVTNLRMSFDCDIILCGYVGGYLEPWLVDLRRRTHTYNRFDTDSSYIRLCRYRKEASATGIALTFIDSFLDSL